MSQPHHRRAFLKRVLGAGAALTAGEALAPRGTTASPRLDSAPLADAASSDPAQDPQPLAPQASPIGPLDHVAVPMQNVEAMIDFYRTLGFTLRDNGRRVSVHFADQKINFHRPTLWQSGTATLRASAARPPCGDFCWVWNGSEQALREALARAGAAIEAEGPRDGGRDGGEAIGQSIYTRDPDGNLLEFMRYA